MKFSIGNWEVHVSAFKHTSVWYILPTLSVDFFNNEIAINFLCFTIDAYAINEAKEREAREKWDNIVKMMKDDDQQNS